MSSQNIENSMVGNGNKFFNHQSRNKLNSQDVACCDE